MAKVFRVSSETKPGSLAKSIEIGIRDSIRAKDSVEIEVIGAGAVNQVIKAIAIARGPLTTEGIDLFFRPVLEDQEVGGRELTVIRLLLDYKK